MIDDNHVLHFFNDLLHIYVPHQEITHLEILFPLGITRAHMNNCISIYQKIGKIDNHTMTETYEQSQEKMQGEENEVLEKDIIMDEFITEEKEDDQKATYKTRSNSTVTTATSSYLPSKMVSFFAFRILITSRG